MILYGEIKMNTECLYSLTKNGVDQRRPKDNSETHRSLLRSTPRPPQPSPLPSPRYFIGSPHGQNMYASWDPHTNEYVTCDR